MCVCICVCVYMYVCVCVFIQFRVGIGWRHCYCFGKDYVLSITVLLTWGGAEGENFSYLNLLLMLKPLLEDSVLQKSAWKK